MNYTAVIEQTRDYPKRMRYMPATGTFEEKDCMSLSYERGVPFPSGWIAGSGTPPCEHLDVIVVTDKPCDLGDRLPVRVIGVFVRGDGDNKLVAVPRDRGITDIAELTADETETLHKLYPKIGQGEGWFGLSFLQSMIMGYEFEDLPKFRFCGSSGSVSRFVMEPDGKVVARYINT